MLQNRPLSCLRTPILPQKCAWLSRAEDRCSINRKALYRTQCFPACCRMESTVCTACKTSWRDTWDLEFMETVYPLFNGMRLARTRAGHKPHLWCTVPCCGPLALFGLCFLSGGYRHLVTSWCLFKAIMLILSINVISIFIFSISLPNYIFTSAYCLASCAKICWVTLGIENVFFIFKHTYLAVFRHFYSKTKGAALFRSSSSPTSVTSRWDAYNCTYSNNISRMG